MWHPCKKWVNEAWQLCTKHLVRKHSRLGVLCNPHPQTGFLSSFVCSRHAFKVSPSWLLSARATRSAVPVNAFYRSGHWGLGAPYQIFKNQHWHTENWFALTSAWTTGIHTMTVHSGCGSKVATDCLEIEPAVNWERCRNKPIQIALILIQTSYYTNVLNAYRPPCAIQEALLSLSDMSL